MINYTVAFDRDLEKMFNKAEMKLIGSVTLMHKKANPHINHVIWDEREGITAIFFDETKNALITTREKGRVILSGEVEANGEMVEELLRRAN